MSYDIYFTKRNDLTIDNIGEFLEADVQKTDPHFISHELKIEIKESLIAIGLDFEVFERIDNSYLELNFPNCQVVLLNSQIALTFPYWDDNSSKGMNKEVKQILSTLLEYKFTGYDPQKEEFITAKYEFGKAFSESKAIVEESIKVLNSGYLILFVQYKDKKCLKEHSQVRMYDKVVGTVTHMEENPGGYIFTLFINEGTKIPMLSKFIIKDESGGYCFIHVDPSNHRRLLCSNEYFAGEE